MTTPGKFKYKNFQNNFRYFLGVKKVVLIAMGYVHAFGRERKNFKSNFKCNIFTW